MAGDNFLYSGANYGLDPEYGQDFQGTDYHIPTSSFGLTIDNRTAAQIKAVSEKLNTGAKVIEVGSVSPEVLESIPKQHFEELNRLRKLVGAELTLHAPIIEPTGVTKQGWNESHRMQAERQLWDSVEKAHALNPEGNVVVTVHASGDIKGGGLPEPETRIMEEGKEVVKEFWVVDKKEGNFAHLPFKQNILEKEQLERENKTSQLSEKEIIDFKIKKENDDNWYKALQHVNFNANNGTSIVQRALGIEELKPESIAKVKEIFKDEKSFEKALPEFYQEYAKGNAGEVLSAFKDPTTATIVNNKMHEIEHGDLYLRDAYGEFKKLFDQAYETAKLNKAEADKKELDKFKDRIIPKLKDIEDPSKIREFSELIQEGVHILRKITPPQTLSPLRDFAVDKASQTFSNLAIQAYGKFKDKAPIISIENPPVGAGFNRAEDLTKLVDAAREKFKQEAMKKFGLSESKAKEEAEKLLGVTWDVGHINMLRKYGYKEKELIEQAEKIKKYVKHMHLSDNFGMEHTELPMGMGNVPKHMIELIAGYNKQIKKVIEVGNWYQHFQTTPFAETATHFNSPIYAMEQAPYWKTDASMPGSYFAGYGMMPDVHYQQFGGGFSGLPTSLSGKMGSKSRFSGAPIE